MIEHEIITIMRAHLRNPESTEQSVGALYAFVIAARFTSWSDEIRQIHAGIEARFLPNGDVKERMQCVDRIKAHGWRLYDAAVAEKKMIAANGGANG